MFRLPTGHVHSHRSRTRPRQLAPLRTAARPDTTGERVLGVLQRGSETLGPVMHVGGRGMAGRAGQGAGPFSFMGASGGR